MTQPMPAPMIAGQSASDTTLTLTFRLGDPLGLIDVQTDLADRLSHAGYLALVRETASRLELYAHDYEAALATEAQPRLEAQERLELRPYIEHEVRYGAV
jgi:hypothetical protein